MAGRGVCFFRFKGLADFGAVDVLNPCQRSQEPLTGLRQLSESKENSIPLEHAGKAL